MSGQNDYHSSVSHGRIISVPLAWSWRLAEATPRQRANYNIIGNGRGVHWPDIDENISAEGMLYGIPAPETSKRKTRSQFKEASGLEQSGPQAKRFFRLLFFALLLFCSFALLIFCAIDLLHFCTSGLSHWTT
jgi:hypothetical protein